jgi:ABC-2 type transport system ATP-binding protein
MERTHIADVSETPIMHLSRGYRQRVALADALVAKPPLLILDEPTAGLDPNQIRQVRALLENLGESHTVLLSTHILSEVETTCDRALVLDRGKLVAEGPVSELERPSKIARLTLRGKKKRALELLEALPDVASVSVEEGPAEGLRLRIELSDGSDGDGLETVVKAMVDAGIGVREAVRVRAHLEDVFSELTRGRK